MARRKRSTSSVSTLQILAAVLFLLLVGIGLAFVLGPERKVKPPVSALSYTPVPENKTAATPSPPDERPRPFGHRNDAAPKPAEEPAPEEAAKFTLTVSVVDSKTNKPVEGARIWAIPGETQEGPRRRANGETDENGQAQLALTLAGAYTVEASAPGFIVSGKGQASVSADAPEAKLNLELSTGASVSGRVTAKGTTGGAEGVTVMIDRDTNDGAKVAEVYDGRWPKTNPDGTYTLGGLAPGEYGVTVMVYGTAFVATETLPFQKITITSPDQEVTGVDFALDTAGIVWGYVTTPKKEPISGVDLVLCTSDSIFSQALTAAIKKARPASATSDETGYYAIKGVPLNQEWRVYATHGDHAPQLSDPFMLTNANKEAQLDVFMFAGTTVRGWVEDSAGQRVAGAAIRCIPSYSKLFSPMDSPQTFRGVDSKEDGSFEIAELAPGEYQLFAHKKGYKVAITGTPIYPDGYSDLNNVILKLDTVDQGTFSVYGTVSDATGKGMSGVEVSLEGFSTANMDDTSEKTTTSSDGSYAFSNVSSGMYRVRAYKEGYSPRTVRAFFDKPTDITLTQSAVLRGRVVVDSGKTPPTVPYTVSAIPLGSEEEGGLLSFASFQSPNTNPEQTFNNPDGSFELYVSPGQYLLQATAADYTPGRIEVVAEAGGVQDNLIITISKEGGRISGTVIVSGRGNPQGAEVRATDLSSAAAGAVDSAQEHVVRVGEDGVFEFTNLPAGEYMITAKHPEYASAQIGPVTLQQQGNVTGLELRLGSGGAIEGYVYLRGKPTANAIVTIAGGAADANTAQTNAEGYYYADGLSTGTYQVMVTPSSGLTGIYQTQGKAVEVIEGQTTRQDFGLGEGTRLEGACTPPPQMAGLIVLSYPGQMPATPNITDLNQLGGVSSAMVNPLGGGFLIEDVLPGDWQVDVYYVGASMGVQLVYREMITVTGEQPVMNLPLNVQGQ